jgi:hypothetical protein
MSELLSSGERYGNLCVESIIKESMFNNDSYVNPSTYKYKCYCTCGNTREVTKRALKEGKTFACKKCQAENKHKEHIKGNNITIEGSIVKVKFNTNSKYILIDKEEYNTIKNYTWVLKGNGYAHTRIGRSFGLDNAKWVYLHDMILKNKPEGYMIDHINGNRLDNRKENLRFVTPSQNSSNVERKVGKSNVLGVWEYKNNWQAMIRVSGKRIYLGYFNNKENAVKARKEAEEKYFGEFSYDNSRNKEAKK